MKKQRNVADGHANVKGTKAVGRAAAATTTTTMTMGKKKGKTRPIDQQVEEERKKGGESSVVEMENNLVGWEDEYWPCLRGVVDEQMSWGSIWLPFWDVEYMGEACTEMFSDVVWDDDIWNLKSVNKIPTNP